MKLEKHFNAQYKKLKKGWDAYGTDIGHSQINIALASAYQVMLDDLESRISKLESPKQKHVCEGK